MFKQIKFQCLALCCFALICFVPRHKATFEPVFVFDYPVVDVEGGTFRMGQPDPNIGGPGFTADECPHSVTVRKFSIGKYEVTQAQWTAVMQSNPSWEKDCDSCAVCGVGWKDAREFIQKLNRLTGRRYRLPTEAEWEFAARGGKHSRGFLYAGSNYLREVASKRWSSYGVGQHKPNELGLYDMSGNVWEWCQDQYGPYPGCREPRQREAAHVCRGGACLSDPEYCRTTARTRNDRDPGLQTIGLRLVQGK